MVTRDVRLLCGPPGAGKTTYAHATGLDVYDLDDPKWHGSERAFRAALAELGGNPTARAIVIRSGARIRSRRIWANLTRADVTVIMATSRDECRRRVLDRNRPRPPMAQQLAAIDKWWRTYQPDPDTSTIGRSSRQW